MGRAFHWSVGKGHWAGAADDDLDVVAWSTGQLRAEREDDCTRFVREALSTG